MGIYLNYPQTNEVGQADHMATVGLEGVKEKTFGRGLIMIYI